MWDPDPSKVSECGGATGAALGRLPNSYDEDPVAGER
jgi:hypothetical protein